MTVDAGLIASSYVAGLDSANAAAGSAKFSLMNRGKAVTPEQADKTAKDFESMFISQMMEQMFGESLGTELFGNEESNDVYKQLLMNEYGKAITASGGIGIADYVKTELLKLQEVSL